MANVVTNNDKLTAEQQRELLRQLLERKAQQPRQIPLSLNQESLWFLDRLDPGRPTYSVYPAFRISGPLNLDALQKSLNEIVSRHEVLRTTFPEVDGVPVQQVAPRQQQEMTIIDLTERPPAEREQELQRIAKVHLPIDLQTGPVLRYRLVRLADDDHVFMMDIHHIVYDGWSLGVFLREMLGLYYAFCDGKPSPLPELSLQYGDFAAWQRDFLQGDRLEELSAYWKDRLSDIQPLDFSTDYPRPAIRTTRGATLPIELSAELSQAVLDFSRRERVTPFMTLLAGFEELLHRYTAQENFAIGTPVANRRQKDLEPLIGYFVNMLVVPADMSGDLSFRELVQRVRTTALESFEHQALTLEKVVDAVQPVRDMSRHPLFQVMFVLQSNPEADWQLPDLEVVPVDEFYGDVTAKFEMTVPLRITPEGIVGKFNYNTDLFARETIERMIAHYQMILADAIASPEKRLSSLPLLLESEQQTILRDWNATAFKYPRDKNLCELIEEHARQTPDAIAVADGENLISYGELNERANRFARYLQRRGIQADSAIVICMERSPELMVVVLGVLKSGGCFVPFDPTHSGDAEQRLKFIYEDSRATLLVTDAATDSFSIVDSTRNISLTRDADAIEAESAENLQGEIAAEQLAYTIYTSGSTGQPKGVMVTHGNLLNAYYGWEQAYQLRSEVKSHLQMASFSFDVFVGDYVRALCSGGKLVVCRKEILLSPDELLGLIRKEEVDIAEFVPVVLRHLVEFLEESRRTLDGMRLLIVGSDAWYVTDHQRTKNVLGHQTRLINSYGLTETTIDSCYFEGDISGTSSGNTMTPIGRPLANVQMYVLDADKRPVPIGAAGELYIGGQGVAKGYVNRPELDSERFVQDPFTESVDARLCRTGDRVRWLADGELEFLGRIDNQIKISGFRIEPGEVEEVLREHPLLSEAAVLARERTAGDLRLVAYVVGQDDDVAEIAEMRRYLGERLPEYMIPLAFVVLDKMPMTSSGKIDRKSLPAPDWNSSQLKSEYVAPRTETEQRLAKIWEDVLQVEQVGLHDNFFDLGGNSLMALRLNSQVRDTFSVELPLVKLFTAPTLAQLTSQIIELQANGLSAGRKPIARVSQDQPIPLSFIQEEFWVVHHLFPGKPVSLIHASIPITGELDLDILQETIDHVVRRHESFRTSFQEDENGNAMQVVAEECHVGIKHEDLSHLSREEYASNIRKLAYQQSSQPFDLSEGPLFRVSLVRENENKHMLLITLHHIICDGWSLQLLTHEVAEIYDSLKSGRPITLPQLPIQYRDFATWQREYLQGEVYDSLLSYWEAKLEGVKNPGLPTDFPRDTKSLHLEEIYPFQFSPVLKLKLERLCRSEGVTLYILFLAAYKVLLHRLCAEDDITVASPVSGRRQPETHGVIGPYINTVALRSDLSGNPTFQQFLAEVRATVLNANQHDDFPYALLANSLKPGRDVSRFPLTQVMFNYLQPTSGQSLKHRRELEFGRENFNREKKPVRLDLSLTLRESDHEIDGDIKYDSALFERDTIELIVSQFRTVLEGIVVDPESRLSELLPDSLVEEDGQSHKRNGQSKLLDEKPFVKKIVENEEDLDSSCPASQRLSLSNSELQKVLVEWNDTDCDYGEELFCVHQMFEAQVEKTPDAVAVVFEGESLTYADLNERSNQLAHLLQEHGVGRESHVGICLERSIEMAVSLIAIPKAGGVFIPIIPSLPRKRQEYIFTESRPTVILTRSDLAEKLPVTDAVTICLDEVIAELASRNEENLSCQVGLDNAVSILFTSGSTGQPKGVVNLHRGLSNLMLSEQKVFGHGNSDRILLYSTLGFDITTGDFFRTLVTGGCLVIARPEGQRDPAYLVDLVIREKVTFISFVPTMLRMFLDEERIAECTSVKTFMLGGEVLSPDLAKTCLDRLNVDLYNCYGPTETSIWVTTWKHCRDYDSGSIPIGRPINNVSLYILDEQQNPVPIGVLVSFILVVTVLPESI